MSDKCPGRGGGWGAFGIDQAVIYIIYALSDFFFHFLYTKPHAENQYLPRVEPFVLRVQKLVK